jgi:hypothetical protein
MIVTAEQLCVGDVITLTAGSRALQPEHEDTFIICCPPEDYTSSEVVIFLLGMWEDIPLVVTVRRDEKVEIYSVHS